MSTGRLAAAACVLLLAGCGGTGAGGPEAGDEGETPAAAPSLALGVGGFRTGYSEIHLLGADGRGRKRLTRRPPPPLYGWGDTEPSWSPDGRRIVFTSSRDATGYDDERGTELYVMGADGTDVRRLTTSEQTDLYPSWSPDGMQIAFARILDRNPLRPEAAIYVVGPDGTGERRLTPGSSRAFDLQPAWSSDGTQIAFARAAFLGPEARPAVYVMRADGSAERKLADDGSSPAWSPDGTRIAFASDRDRNGQTCYEECRAKNELYVMNADGTGQRRLTTTRAEDLEPDWSPDGGRLAFVSDRAEPAGHKFELYVMNADGSCPTRLTRNRVRERAPDWRPGSTGTDARIRCTPANGPARSLPSGVVDPGSSARFTMISNRGVRVARLVGGRPFRSRSRVRAFLLARRGETAFYRLEESETCYSIARLRPREGNAYRLGVDPLYCPGPSTPPLLDRSRIRGSRSDRRLQGFAADGVVRVAAVDATGAIVVSTPVRDNVYLLARLPDADYDAVIPLDRAGRSIVGSR